MAGRGTPPRLLRRRRPQQVMTAADPDDWPGLTRRWPSGLQTAPAKMTCSSGTDGFRRERWLVETGVARMASDNGGRKARASLGSVRWKLISQLRSALARKRLLTWLFWCPASALLPLLLLLRYVPLPDTAIMGPRVAEIRKEKKK